ncbi:MAG: class I tRNA ligase family protein [Firmicutes bacterium]|nr:class I tRNA ligase family protein [Bacillota bacterium]
MKKRLWALMLALIMVFTIIPATPYATIMNLQDEEGNFRPMADGSCGAEKLALKDEDKWILSTINDAVAEITANLDKFELSLAAQKIYDLIWNEFCDWYIELVKARLYGDDEEDKKVARYVLVKALKDMLKLLHPFMPFITEEIWSYLPQEGNTEAFLMKESWPVYTEALHFEEEEAKLKTAMDAIRSIRNIRAEADAAPSRKLSAVILASGKEAGFMKDTQHFLKNIANVQEITFIDSKDQVPDEVMSAVMNNVEIYVPLDDLLDYSAELERLKKEKTRLEGEVKRTAGKLNNEGFVAKAPEAVVNAEREKLAKYEDMLAKIIERIPVVEAKVK